MIYVLERGCQYEGGSAFAASTSHIAAWKEMRKHRPANARLVAKDCWLDDYDYYIIKELGEVAE